MRARQPGSNPITSTGIVAMASLHVPRRPCPPGYPRNAGLPRNRTGRVSPGLATPLPRQGAGPAAGTKCGPRGPVHSRTSARLGKIGGFPLDGTKMRSQVLLSWSGGKDAAWTLHALRQRDDVDVVGLLTTITEGYERVAMQGIRVDVLHAQAAAAGLPVIEARMPQRSSN